MDQDIIAKLINISGNVVIQREDLEEPIFASEEVGLYKTDLIFIDVGSSATIVCYDGTPYTLAQNGRFNIPCNLPPSIFEYQKARHLMNTDYTPSEDDEDRQERE
ncbi:MAG: hypothetical protein R2880_08040 [Deinococcales bacterium]